MAAWMDGMAIRVIARIAVRNRGVVFMMFWELGSEFSRRRKVVFRRTELAGVLQFVKQILIERQMVNLSGKNGCVSGVGVGVIAI